MKESTAPFFTTKEKKEKKNEKKKKKRNLLHEFSCVVAMGVEDQDCHDD